MKRLNQLFAIAVIFSACATANAASYGRITISGIALTDNNIVIYASDYSGGYQENECAQTDWWWPAGTAYAFWTPKANHDLEYRQFSMAYMTGESMWIGTAQESLAFAAGVPCRIHYGTGINIGY